MTREEVKELLTIMQTYYPQSFRDTSAESASILLNLWSKAMENEDPVLVKRALWEIINNEDREFAPNIAQIRKKMLSMTGATEGHGILPVDEAWATARSFWSSLSSDNAWEIEPRWKKLPKEIRRVLTPQDMVEYAFKLTSHQITQYEKPRFYRLYEDYAEESRQKLVSGQSITKLAIEAKNMEVGHVEPVAIPAK